MAYHPQSGCDRAARRGRAPAGAARLSQGRRDAGRHGRHPAGRDRGAGAGRGRPPPQPHPAGSCHGGAEDAQGPGASAGRDPGGKGERLSAGLGGLFPGPARPHHRRRFLSGRRLPGQYAHGAGPEDGGGRAGLRGP